jgi:NADPH2:quinone reductase
MRAIEVRTFGGPDALVLAERPEPVAGPGQVVIAVAAADIIYLDTLLRTGWGNERFPRPLPYVPGGGVSGTVIAIGEDVDDRWLGQAVVARVSGGYAEKALAAAEDLVEVPAGLGHETAAALIHDGVTALQFFALGEVGAGEWVLVMAAGGGAGSILVQLARRAGARVIAAARGDEKLDLAGQLGAEIAVDYGQLGWADRVRSATGGVGPTTVFDGAGGALGREAFGATAPAGRFVTYGTAAGEMSNTDAAAAKARGVRVINPLLAPPRPKLMVLGLLKEALALPVEGIQPHIWATYPLERASEAHRSLMQRRVVGKSLLVMQPDDRTSARPDAER